MARAVFGSAQLVATFSLKLNNRYDEALYAVLSKELVHINILIPMEALSSSQILLIKFTKTPQ